MYTFIKMLIISSWLLTLCSLNVFNLSHHKERLNHTCCLNWLLKLTGFWNLRLSNKTDKAQSCDLFHYIQIMFREVLFRHHRLCHVCHDPADRRHTFKRSVPSVEKYTCKTHIETHACATSTHTHRAADDTVTLTILTDAHKSTITLKLLKPIQYIQLCRE